MTDACNVAKKKMRTADCMITKHTGNKAGVAKRHEQAPAASSHQQREKCYGKEVLLCNKDQRKNTGDEEENTKHMQELWVGRSKEKRRRKLNVLLCVHGGIRLFSEGSTRKACSHLLWNYGN